MELSRLGMPGMPGMPGAYNFKQNYVKRTEKI
jgi:hypothetical protein